ncbi:MAG TPA: radical SAM family heme chaperone HemW [Anaerolineales bacterium]|nr:radical SAM family heme chaperone HemW [Anaerolineales bacterium]
MTPYSLYLHIPFCVHRCAYCDFNTYAGQEDMIPAYVEALTREINFVGNQLQTAQFPNLPSTKSPNHQITVHTIFFGGGTPSLLFPKQFASILGAIRNNFILTSDAEITIEANPGTVSYENLLELRRVGINRISYGVQSANTEELRMLERAHNFFDVIEAVTSARKAGFDNLNLDLIYGLPAQTLSTWQTTVKRILDLHPEHISAYALTLEHGTPFGRWSSKGLLPLPDPDLAADMYEWAGEMFEANGYTQYEISNWAKTNDKGKMQNDEYKSVHSSFCIHYSQFECRHNLQYWRGLPYLAFGAGAHGYANGYRYSNVLRIKTYVDRLTNSQPASYQFPLSPATVNHHKQSLKDDMSEFMMTGLRLTQEGISEKEFQKRFGRSMFEVYGKEIDELLKSGLIEFPSPIRAAQSNSENEAGRGDGIRLTKRGRLLGNQVFMRFI